MYADTSVTELGGIVRVALSHADWAEGVAAGLSRDAENQKNHMIRQTHGAEQRRSGEYHARGGVGEKAGAVMLGVTFGGKGRLGEVDIAGTYEIKSSAHPNLLLNKSVAGVHGNGDRNDAIYVAGQVRDLERDVLFLGWAYGHDVMTDQNWGDHFRNGRPCWRALPSDLNPMSSLPHLEKFPDSWLSKRQSQMQS